MSGTSLDVLGGFASALEASGWRKAPIVLPRRQAAMIGKPTGVFERGDDLVVVLGPIGIPKWNFGSQGGNPASGTIQDIIDDHFHAVMEFLSWARSRYQGRITIVFKSGGIPLPQWFLGFCRQDGIDVEFLDEDLDDIRRKLGNMMI